MMLGDRGAAGTGVSSPPLSAHTRGWLPAGFTSEQRELIVPLLRRISTKLQVQKMHTV